MRLRLYHVENDRLPWRVPAWKRVRRTVYRAREIYDFSNTEHLRADEALMHYQYT